MKTKVSKKVRFAKAKMNIKRLHKHFGFIKSLVAASKNNIKKVKSLIKKATNSELLALTEVVLNLLRKKIPLSVTQKRILCPFRNYLREVSSKRTNCAKKRKIFANQRGGILGIIGTVLGAALPVIKSLISSFTSG